MLVSEVYISNHSLGLQGLTHIVFRQLTSGRGDCCRVGERPANSNHGSVPLAGGCLWLFSVTYFETRFVVTPTEASQTGIETG